MNRFIEESSVLANENNVSSLDSEYSSLVSRSCLVEFLQESNLSEYDIWNLINERQLEVSENFTYVLTNKHICKLINDRSLSHIQHHMMPAFPVEYYVLPCSHGFLPQERFLFAVVEPESGA